MVNSGGSATLSGFDVFAPAGEPVAAHARDARRHAATRLTASPIAVEQRERTRRSMKASPTLVVSCALIHQNPHEGRDRHPSGAGDGGATHRVGGRAPQTDDRAESRRRGLGSPNVWRPWTKPDGSA